MPGQDTPATRDNLMGDLFGRAPRVALACWISERREPFIQTDAQEAVVAVGYRGARSSVPSDLAVFVKYQMLSRADDAGRKYFTPDLDHPLWAVFTAIQAEAERWSTDPTAPGRNDPGPTIHSAGS